MPMNKSQYIQQDNDIRENNNNVLALNWCGKSFRWKYMVHKEMNTADSFIYLTFNLSLLLLNMD
jgi:hypothetical protein